MSTSHRIIDLLARERGGLTAKEITKRLQPFFEEELNLRTVHVLISSIVNKGYLRTDDKKVCVHCGGIGVCYRITAAGREYLQHKKECGYYL